MELFRQIMSWNPVLMLSALSWLAAQVIKVIINLIVHKTVDFKLLVSSGGMPSSHSSLVCACTMSIGGLYGFESGLFALSAVVSMVVMYDACNVRRAAGEQAKILNYILDNWDKMSPSLVGKELKELLGHTPFQVLMGALLGIAIGWFGVALLL